MMDVLALCISHLKNAKYTLHFVDVKMSMYFPQPLKPLDVYLLFHKNQVREKGNF